MPIRASSSHKNIYERYSHVQGWLNGPKTMEWMQKTGGIHRWTRWSGHLILLIRVHFFTTALEKHRRSPWFFITQITNNLNFEEKLFWIEIDRSNAQQLTSALSHSRTTQYIWVTNISPQLSLSHLRVKRDIENDPGEKNPWCYLFWSRFLSVIDGSGLGTEERRDPSAEKMDYWRIHQSST